MTEDLPPGYAVLRTAPRIPTLVVRLVTGAYLAADGVSRLTQPGARGALHLESIGMPMPGLVSPLFAGFELVAAALILLGLGVRVAVLPILTIRVWELALTMPAPPPPSDISVGTGSPAWALLLLCGLSYLLLAGAGPGSLDRRIHLSAGDRGG